MVFIYFFIFKAHASKSTDDGADTVCESADESLLTGDYCQLFYHQWINFAQLAVNQSTNQSINQSINQYSFVRHRL